MALGAAAVVVAGGGAMVGARALAGDDGADLVVVGDSFAEQSHRQLLAQADDRGIDAEVFALGGTAVCGWDPQLQDLADHAPDHLVLSFAGNDLQPCINDTGQPRPPEVVADDYRADIEAVIEQFRPDGTRVHVVLPPPIRDAQFEANAAAMRDMYRALAADHPDVPVIDPSPLLGPDGAFHATLPCRPDEPCDPDGTVTLRQDDGIHLTDDGGGRYAESILTAVFPDAS